MTENTTSYHVFPSGLRLVHRLTPSPVTYLGVMVGAGTRHERLEENGMAHYIEHCVFKGTTSRTSRQIINRIETIGGEINAYTTKEETSFYAAVPAEYFARALELLSDMVLHPTFPKEETAKERCVIYDEIESYNDSPSELIYDDFESLVFDGSSLAQPILGTKRTLRYFTAEKAHAFMKRCYRPERMVIFAETSVPFARFLREAEKMEQQLRLSVASRLETSAAPLAEPVLPDASSALLPATHNLQLKKRTHQSHVMLGGKAYPIGHPRQLCAYLLNNILGGGSMNSLLNMSLREQKGLVYTVDSIYTPLSDTGYWSVYFASEPEHKDQCIALVKQTLQRLAQKPLSDAAFRRALRQLRGQLAIAAENRENAALSMAKLVLYRGVAPSWQDTLAAIEKFTPADLQQVAAELFREDNQYSLQYI